MTNLKDLYPAGPTMGQRQQLREAGWSVVDGRVAPDGRGYYPARAGGGYSVTLVTCHTAVQITRGCPSSHAEVAYK